MSVRLSDEVELQLGALAQATGRTKSWLANQAIQDYLAREAWQVAEIEAALNEADAGDFVLEQEMEARFNRWGLMRVKWLRKAALNLEDAHDYLVQENPRVAQEFVHEVYRLVWLLKDQPAMGRPGRVPGTRELVVQPYPFLIPYRVKDEEIHILRVFHTRLRLPSHW